MDADGADAWALADVLAAGVSVGAPPDNFTPRGQDWGLPPWRPDRLAATGYAGLRDMLRAILSHADGLRIDHVAGLWRLWWIPPGDTPDRGTYVHYDADVMLAVLALEAHRAGAVVVGEDLGTVEPEVTEALAANGMLGSAVSWFTRDEADPDQPCSRRRRGRNARRPACPPMTCPLRRLSPRRACAGPRELGCSTMSRPKKRTPPPSARNGLHCCAPKGCWRR